MAETLGAREENTFLRNGRDVNTMTGEENGKWVDIPTPVMAYPPPAGRPLSLESLGGSGATTTIILILLGAIAAVVFLGAIKDASCSCRNK